MDRIWLLATTALLFLSLGFCEPAAAIDPFGLYIGGGVGHATVRADDVAFVDSAGATLSSPISLGSNAGTGWKVVGGLRPISLLGAEIEYIDFGHPTSSLSSTGSGFNYSAAMRAKATVLQGLLFAPLPVPIWDVYGKAGMAHLESSVDANGAGCFLPVNCLVATQGSFHRTQTSTRFAFGAGAQAKLGSIAIRAEYERINAREGSPDLLSINVVWMIP